MQNARISAQKFFFSATLKSWNCDTIITIGINKHEVVENYNFEALCGHCFNIKAFLMQEQGDCSPLTL